MKLESLKVKKWHSFTSDQVLKKNSNFGQKDQNFFLNKCLKKWPKMLWANQIAELFDNRFLYKETIDILSSLHEVIHQEKIAFETNTFLVGWNQLCFSTTQIAGFFDHQYLWKNQRISCTFFMEKIIMIFYLVYIYIYIYIYTYIHIYIHIHIYIYYITYINR